MMDNNHTPCYWEDCCSNKQQFTTIMVLVTLLSILRLSCYFQYYEKIKLASSQPKHLDDGYNQKKGLLNKDKEKLYETMFELWPIGKVVPKEPMFLPYVFCGMVQTKEGIDYPMHFYQHEFGMVLVFNEIVDITIKNKDVI